MVEKAFIVVGLGYGDEGKGIATDFLCSKYPHSLVIRFNGGHQAGHAVVNDKGEKHIFSNFGAGTLRNIPTFWSKFCTFCPPYFIEELYQLDIKPKFYIDKNCPITTHYDILYNRLSEISQKDKRKGSCGVGIGATVDRNKNGVTFSINDLLNEAMVAKKLKQIRTYYRTLVNIETNFNYDDFDHEENDKIFLDSIKELKLLVTEQIFNPTTEKEIFTKKTWQYLIFEGAQGIMIDQNFGTKPYITKSNTTSQNAISIIKRNNVDCEVDMFYVTRCYQTRHGNGYFKPPHKKFKLINNSDETNIENQYQGILRANFIDVDDLNYAISCDKIFSECANNNILITCLDHLPDDSITYFKRNELQKINCNKFPELLNYGFDKIYLSRSNVSTKIYNV